jgi:hypothetical protein
MVMVNRVKKGWYFLAFFGLGILLMITGSPHAQKQPKPLTILYTNNINGEIDPCPT